MPGEDRHYLCIHLGPVTQWWEGEQILLTACSNRIFECCIRVSQSFIITKTHFANGIKIVGLMSDC